MLHFPLKTAALEIVFPRASIFKFSRGWVEAFLCGRELVCQLVAVQLGHTKFAYKVNVNLQDNIIFSGTSFCEKEDLSGRITIETLKLYFLKTDAIAWIIDSSPDFMD